MAIATETMQYLTFILNGETFAVDISKVREVLEYPMVTKVPQMPSYVDGVIDIRGSGVPVVDLRVKFGMYEGEKTVNTCVVIVEVMIANRQTVIGAVVDSVQEVMELDSNKIEPPPTLGISINSSYIKGMGKRGERFTMILDIDKVFASDDMSFMHDGHEDNSEGVDLILN
ncbi:MAG: chemotaxis protein CheW [Candidatus Magnetominusculus sp. LBB02]|nr:chemotaxis protein CheW [Candidatus Magnetominusculus sp. LBB02]